MAWWISNHSKPKSVTLTQELVLSAGTDYLRYSGVKCPEAQEVSDSFMRMLLLLKSAGSIFRNEFWTDSRLDAYKQDTE